MGCEYMKVCGEKLVVGIAFGGALTVDVTYHAMLLCSILTGSFLGTARGRIIEYYKVAL
jgi:hypothetical protein